MHDLVAPEDLPSLRDLVRTKIEVAADLPAELADFALEKLDALPDGDRLCHGDFHPGNILLGGDGPAVIDWTDAPAATPPPIWRAPVCCFVKARCRRKCPH